MAKFYNAYGESKFAQIKGDKALDYCKVIFEEAKLYKQDNGYVLAGQFSIISGLQRAYGNDPINPCLCELPIYDSEYELREKNATTSKWEAIKVQPSTSEKTLCRIIKENESSYIAEGRALKGEFSFAPNGLLEGKDDLNVYAEVVRQWNVEAITASGKYPDWTPPKGNRSGFNNSNFPKGATIDDKVAFLKKELAETIIDTGYKEKIDVYPLSAFVDRVIIENLTKEHFLSAYFSLLNSVVN